MSLDDIYRAITNTIYGVPGQVAKFRAREPNAELLAAGATKGRKLAEDRTVRHESGWITARRATLILTNDRLVCGSWVIPLDTIEKATLLRVRSLLARALILKVSTADGSAYQFGLQYDSSWEKQRALKLTIEDGKIKHSAFSVAIRVASLFLLVFACSFFALVIFLIVSTVGG